MLPMHYYHIALIFHCILTTEAPRTIPRMPRAHARITEAVVSLCSWKSFLSIADGICSSNKRVPNPAWPDRRWMSFFPPWWFAWYARILWEAAVLLFLSRRRSRDLVKGRVSGVGEVWQLSSYYSLVRARRITDFSPEKRTGHLGKYGWSLESNVTSLDDYW